jgi:type VI secretion system secreted protein VgrG
MPTPFTLTTPLPAGELRFESMSHSSGLSMLGEMQLQLLSEKPDIDPEKMLGHPVELSVALRDGGSRHFCGYVTRFGIGRHQGRQYGYQAEVQSWLWFLTRTADCRIFQDKTVPEIVEAVFKDHDAVANYAFKIVRSYRKRVYCAQYRETDFNFVARLMEDEGIYWYFEHSAGKHKLVLVDAPSAHVPMAGNPKLPFYDNDGQAPPDTEYVSDWRSSRAVKSGKTALTSYDFERPSVQLKVERAHKRNFPQSDLELFDYQGDYIQKADGQQLVDDRLDEQQCRYEQMGGSSNAHALASGHLFELARHPHAGQNGKYLCVQLEVSAREQAFESGGAGAGGLQCSLTAIRSDQTFRPLRRTPKPFVQGPQTAVVVGPSGDEIYTDKYGRVKLQFHWDRYGSKNEKSSCWVRVSSPWAGKSFGFVQVPRIGQEVVVDFLEGDPDQPIITGRVYNAEQMPPWELPANATQSGVLTRSSKGGAYGTANALRFEDKKGSEQLWLHAEKNQDIEVENDETHWVGHDRTKTIDHDETTHVKHDRTETVDNNETITIHNNRTETVDKEESITIHGGRTETVDKNETITIGGSRTESVSKDETISISGGRTESVSKDESISIDGGRTETVGKDESVTISGGRTVEIGKELATTVGKKESRTVGDERSTSIAKDDKLQVGKKYVLEAADEITLKTGDASITMKKDGTIQIKGKDITVTGSGKIGIKASGDLVLKGSKIAGN